MARRDFIYLTDLRDEPFILFQEQSMLRNIVIEHCKKHGFSPNIAFEAKDIDAIKGLVSASLGVSLVPEITVIDQTPRATVAVPIRKPIVTRTVGMIVPAERDLLPTERLFYEFKIGRAHV